MSLQTVRAVDVISRLHEFDTLIDARSEDEYAEDHLPNALNWPTLNNAERKEIGTLYKQANAFEAKKRGAAMAARNVATHIERFIPEKTKDWRPLTYCWRGGKRSGFLSLVLGEIGFKVTLIEGGYKAFRAALVSDIERLTPLLRLQVVCGTTGSGKTRLLHALTRQGQQVLDLEALANHRGSVLGAVPGLAQPTQKHFDTLLWTQLRQFDVSKPIYVESESKKVGNLTVPESLIQNMRTSPCLNVVLPDDERLALLLEDYDFLTRNPDYFCDRLQALVQLRGKVCVNAWQDAVRAGDCRSVFADLLKTHYDPIYLQSMQRNFKQYGTAISIAAKDHTTRAFDQLALEIAQQCS